MSCRYKHPFCLGAEDDSISISKETELDKEFFSHCVKPDNPEHEGYIIKDSGRRKEFAGGMVRDVTEGKINYLLTLGGPMFQRWAAHLTNGAVKYTKGNWMKAAGQEELERFKESAFRHFIQWLNGDIEEDHAAAIIFNVNGAEYVEERLAEAPEDHARLYEGSYQ